MVSSTARINNITVKKGDIIEVKFKSFESILAFYKEHGFRTHDVIQMTGIADHLVSLSRGGLFAVESVSSDYFQLPEIGRNQKPRVDRPEEITLCDHNNEEFDEWTINEHLIESIEVREDVGDRYFSDKFQLSLVKVDGILIINGVPLDRSDKELINILEKTIADMSIRNMLEAGDGDED